MTVQTEIFIRVQIRSLHEAQIECTSLFFLFLYIRANFKIFSNVKATIFSNVKARTFYQEI